MYQCTVDNVDFACAALRRQRVIRENQTQAHRGGQEDLRQRQMRKPVEATPMAFGPEDIDYTYRTWFDELVAKGFKVPFVVRSVGSNGVRHASRVEGDGRVEQLETTGPGMMLPITVEVTDARGEKAQVVFDMYRLQALCAERQRLGK